MNGQWLKLVNDLITNGKKVSPRGQPTREILGRSTTVNIDDSVLTIPGRKLGYKFMCAEAAWILSGDNRLSTIEPYSRDIHKFSDNGVHFAGAYGPQFIDQVSYVVDCLLKDEDTRQAVMTIWRPNPRPSKDTPCTVYVQFIIRDGELHVFDYMRSSDAWLGFPYDIFNFSMAAYYVLIMLKMKGIHLKPGKITLIATSQHIYDRNLPAFYEDINSKSKIGFDGEYYTSQIPYKPLDIDQFDKPKQLVDMLWDLANGKWKQGMFLADLMEKVYGQNID
jgi:thymidylate synthase